MFFQNVQLIKSPNSKERVVFQCDKNYFEEWGIFNLLSCNEQKIDVHIHFINVDDATLNYLASLKLNIDVSISSEILNTKNINFYKLKSYYFCSRYFITNWLFENNLLDSAYITDADIIFNDRIFFKDIDLGVLYYPNENNLWRQSGANITYVTKQRNDFLKKIIELYNKKLTETNFDLITPSMGKFEKALLYALDQVCMSTILKDEDTTKNNFLNLDNLKNFIGQSDQYTIWSLTGGNQKSNPLIRKKLLNRFKNFF